MERFGKQGETTKQFRFALLVSLPEGPEPKMYAADVICAAKSMKHVQLGLGAWPRGRRGRASAVAVPSSQCSLGIYRSNQTIVAAAATPSCRSRPVKYDKGIMRAEVRRPMWLVGWGIALISSLMWH